MVYPFLSFRKQRPDASRHFQQLFLAHDTLADSRVIPVPFHADRTTNSMTDIISIIQSLGICKPDIFFFSASPESQIIPYCSAIRSQISVFLIHPRSQDKESVSPLVPQAISSSEQQSAGQSSASSSWPRKERKKTDLPVFCVRRDARRSADRLTDGGQQS